MDRPVCQDSSEARTWPLRAVCHDEENFLQRPVHPISCVACIKAVVSKVLFFATNQLRTKKIY